MRWPVQLTSNASNALSTQLSFTVLGLSLSPQPVDHRAD
jgi:hypothetical protein